MNYIKKLCILKQVASGFAADGKDVSALLTAESFGGRLTLTVAPIGFAPLAAGRYRCVVADTKGHREAFDLPVPSGASVRRAGTLDLNGGIGCAVCFVSGKATPVAFGKTGDGTYDPKVLCAPESDLPHPNRGPDLPHPKGEDAPPLQAERARQQEPAPENGQNRADERTDSDGGSPFTNSADASPYDDEMVATENYFAFADDTAESAACADGKERAEAERADDESDAEPGEDKTDPTEENAEEQSQTLFRLSGKKDAAPCYYDRVRGDLEALFARHPAERDLADCIPYSRWAKVTFSRNKYYAVGVISDETTPKYICYGVPAASRTQPPAALEGFCSFLPLSVFEPDGRGYWMMFQDAETGQCVRIERK